MPRRGCCAVPDASTLMPIFLGGALRYPALRDVVVGRRVGGAAAELQGFGVVLLADSPAVSLVPDAAGSVHGVLLGDLTAPERSRISYYSEVTGFRLRAVLVVTLADQVNAVAPEVREQSSAPGSTLPDLTDWQARWGAIVVQTAQDVMAGFGQDAAARLAARYPQMLVRGASRVRGRDAAPTRLRRHAGEADVRVDSRSLAYAGFFALEDYHVSWHRFRGDMGPATGRAVFVSGDAVTVLPYDPVRDRVLVIEQFRVGAMARGDAQPWLLEPIAGRIDPGESPEDAARREAVEEAGLTLGALVPVASYYPSAGAKTEFLYSYLAIADLPDAVAGVFGLAEESEDIRSHILPFAELMALVSSGEANTAPLILSALWLERERPRLRAEAGVQPGS